MLVLLAFGLASLAGGARAEDAGTDGINPFAKTYLSLELARNYPVSFSQDRFEPGRYGFALGYRHDLDQHWIMGVGGEFKMFKRRPSDDPADDDKRPSDVLAILTLTHETLYAIRLNHPTYLLLGPKLHLLLPANGAKLPLQRADDYQGEKVGAAVSMVLAHLLDERYMLTARIDRWRSISTQHLHGIEVAVGVGFALR
jgi:hypothetical protein